MEGTIADHTEHIRGITESSCLLIEPHRYMKINITFKRFMINTTSPVKLKGCIVYKNYVKQVSIS